MARYPLFVIVPTWRCRQYERTKNRYLAERQLKDYLWDILEPYYNHCADWWEPDNPVIRQNACDCINQKASQWGWKTAEKKAGTFESYEASFKEKVEAGGVQPDWDNWWAHIQPFVRARREATRNHPAYMKPDPKCDLCYGTGWWQSYCDAPCMWTTLAIDSIWGQAFNGKPYISIHRWLKTREPMPEYFVDARGFWHENQWTNWVPGFPGSGEGNRRWEQEVIEYFVRDKKANSLLCCTMRD